MELGTREVKKVTVELEDGEVIELQSGRDFVSGYYRVYGNNSTQKKIPLRTMWTEYDVHLRSADGPYIQAPMG